MLEKILFTLVTILCVGMVGFFIRKFIDTLEKNITGKVDALERKQDKINGSVDNVIKAHNECQASLVERFAPKDATYQHHLRWQDGNGHSHVRAAIIGPSVTIPVIEGQLPLGTWQQIVFLELDVHPRTRRLIIQIIGEK